MTSHREILQQGKASNEPPAETLGRLFATRDMFGPEDANVAFVCVSYRAPNSGGMVTGSAYVRKDLLELHEYRVWRGLGGHICIDILDYVNYRWPRNGGALNLSSPEYHAACISIMKADAERLQGPPRPQ